MQLKKNLLILLIASSVLSGNVKADIIPDAYYLTEGEKAQFSGMLIPTETVQELRKSVMELQNQQLVSSSLQKSVDLYKANEELYDVKVTTLSKRNDYLAASLYSAKSTSMWVNAAFFGLGALLTGTLSYGIYTSAVKN